MAARSSAGNSGHNNSSASVNLKDKITAKIRDCFTHHYSTTESASNSMINNQSRNNTNHHQSKEQVIDDTVNEENNDSVEWHTPCDELPDENRLVITSPPNGGSRVLRALFRYKPTHADEITFEPGDVVVLLHETSERGWWFGEHQPTGKTGLFPANYVEPFTKSEKEPRPKKTNSTSSNSSYTRRAPGRLTALEEEIAALRSKVDTKPSVEQLKSLEEEVDRLKIVASVVNSPNLLSTVGSPLFREPLVMNHIVNNHPVKQLTQPSQVNVCNNNNDSKETGKPVLQNFGSTSSTSSTIMKPNLAKAPTELLVSSGTVTKPGQIKVPACFLSKTPTGQASLNTSKNTTPQLQQLNSSASKNSATFRPLILSAGRVSTSPASTHALAVRVNAVNTPNSIVTMMEKTTEAEVDETNFMDTTDASSVSTTKESRKASVLAAGKLKRRSITHYTKKCERKFSKLCHFYEKLAENGRLGLVAEARGESASPSVDQDSPSSLPLSMTASEQSTIFAPKSTRINNRSSDNPFQKSFDSTMKNSPAGSKRFPAFNASATLNKTNSISSVLLKKQEQFKQKQENNAQSSGTESPSLKNIRRPPMNKLKMGTTALSTPQPIQNVNKARYARCSSANADRASSTTGDEAEPLTKRESVNDIRRRFESISTTQSVVTNAIDSQPREKRQRKCTTNSETSTPTSAKRRNQRADNLNSSKTGKDSGLGSYPARRSSRHGGDSTADLFNNAQTTQVLEDSSSASSNSPRKTVTIKASKPKTYDDPRCSSASMMNEAGIFDCSLTWTETSSDSATEHHERNAAVFGITKTVTKNKHRNQDDFVRV